MTEFWSIRTWALFTICWSLSALVLFGSFQFVLLWFQYIGFSDNQTAILLAFFQLGAGLGQILGGVLGDRLAIYSPRFGRLMIAEISFVLASIFFIVLYWGVSHTPDGTAAHSAALFFLGMACNLSLAGCDLPVLSEIVHNDMRARSVCLDSIHVIQLSISNRQHSCFLHG
jgi:MFS family permease